ncbi:SDR family oxidoreductase [Pseudomonas entomophila]|uniref:SDR family NAD(P)-dependent oxidoreductase n=1 Tax=Pseudomonas entomophila TaxID=312306 RepID=UPI001BCE0044|nr:SDR family oxidoreductase [Pseudomonas entomophila]QVM89195.1 SDR family oxidoreductase [Pseudomonas entomophila]
MSRLAVVTGGNSGIGEACAWRFAREGYEVVVCGRREERNGEVCDRIRQAGGVAHGYAVDLRDSRALFDCFRRIAIDHPPVTCLVNSIGIEGTPFTRTEDYDDAVFDDVIASNVKAPWQCMRAVLPTMRLARAGSIVNVASLAGIRASATGGSAYSASKHALVGITRATAREYAPFGIRINAVCPAFVRTPLSEGILGDDLESVGGSHPMNRICEAQEVASAVYWLCSQDASFVTGIAMPVDGGTQA